MLCSFSSPEKAPLPSQKAQKKNSPSVGGQYYFWQRGLFFNEENERGVFLRPELWHEPAPFRSLMLGPWGLLVCRHSGDSCRFSKKTYVGCSTKQRTRNGLREEPACGRVVPAQERPIIANFQILFWPIVRFFLYISFR